MGHKPIEAPALFSLSLFLGLNYVVGYCIGHLLTGSEIGAGAIALVTPCLTLLGLALFGGRSGEADQKGPIID
ncbi:MAG TPA: hypothetical protein VK533_09475 [Sphingomonas sp.]|uniref:hypothetical protein n=1 Tax=Sphingomonas sp. TaxID=28214 RepID=UPI002C942A62|nr:hypothetical protein [Sphingomonas sp.]HMI19762.1 hypothetical protein [Sphingomonas sp.]